MSFEKSDLMSCLVMATLPSEDLRAVVVFRVEYAHKAKSGGSIEVARVEEDRGNVHAALKLLKQREGPIDGEERSRSHDEHDVAQGFGILRHPCRNEIHERGVLREDGVDRLHDCPDSLLALRGEPFLKWVLRSHGLVKTLRKGDALDALPFLAEARLQQRNLLPELELLVGVVAEERIGHIVVCADALARVAELEDRLENLLNAMVEVAHATILSAYSRELAQGSVSWTRLPATSYSSFRN